MLAKATHQTLRNALQAAAEGQGSMLEGTVSMPLDKAQEFATRLMLADETLASVRMWNDGSWLHIDPPTK